jgi:succinoglycan biosynthesis transport protein ExoP
MADQSRQGLSFVDVAASVWGRRKWLALLTAAAVLTGGIALVYALPKLYQSTVTVVVDRHQVPESFVKSAVTTELEPRLNMLTQNILSRSRLLALVERFDLYRGMRGRASEEDIAERMRKDVGVELKTVERKNGEGMTTVAFSLTYRGPNPATVAAVTNTLASFFIAENENTRKGQAAATAELVKAQLQETRKKLEAQEERVAGFRKKYVGALPQQAMTNMVTLERLHTELRANADNQSRLAERRIALMQQPADPALAGPPGSPDALAAQLARLKQELTQLRTQYSEKYPDVVRAKNEIAMLERQLAERNTQAKPADPQAAAADMASRRQTTAVGLLEADMRRLKADEQRIRDSIATYQTRVEDAPAHEQEFQELSRDYETTRELYRSLLGRYEEAVMGQTMEQRRTGEVFRVIDPATAAETPAAPNVLRLGLLIIALALGLGVAAAIVAEQLDTSFHSVDALRSFTSVEVAAAIPAITTEDDVLQRRRRVRLVAAGAMLGLALIGTASYWVGHGNDQLVSLLAKKS